MEALVDRLVHSSTSCIHFIMATAVNRISVVRIPRQYANQINPADVQDQHPKPLLLPREETPTHDAQHSRLQDDSFRTKTDIFVLTEREHPSQETKSPLTVQPRPNQFPTLIKPSLGTENRPFLNWKGTAKWSNGLCTLCDDFNMFCYACSCWCCFRHELTSMMNEHWILWYLNCTPLMELRTKFRQRYGIRGSIAEDCCLSAFCPLCVGLQIANEGRHYGHRIFC